ncbi:MAG: hypothetical protein KBS47_05505 [Bacteroidales bacterium]|nr:hypothetical protein [Candidatus Equimonas enterica]
MIYDFFSGAFPWLILGLIIALIAAGKAQEKDTASADASQQESRLHRAQKGGKMYFVASILSYLTATMACMSDGHYTHSGLVWTCLGSLFLCLGATQARRDRKK